MRHTCWTMHAQRLMVLIPRLNEVIHPPANAVRIGPHKLQELLHLVPRRDLAVERCNRRLVAHKVVEHAFVEPSLDEEPPPEPLCEVQHLCGQDLRGSCEQPERDAVQSQGLHQVAALIPAEPVWAEHRVSQQRLRAEVLQGALPGHDRVEVRGPWPTNVACVSNRAVGVADVTRAPARQVKPGADKEHRLDEGQELLALPRRQQEQGQCLACP
mmetsp:Transcript_6043/g.19405  ORF Transcript_6043/g.19405 Transcript_6043/m.19405 type:complete len:214 (-) Transcript_6043:722-1363(-)